MPDRPPSQPTRTPDDAKLEAPDADRNLALRVVPMPRDTNPYGTIFGGVILSYIDQAGLVEALSHAACPWVTASIERVDFNAPVHLGDVVSFYTRTIRTGTTSVRVGVEVESLRRTSNAVVRVTTATLTMVAVGPDGRPTPWREACGMKPPPG
jgi:acyl-CoA thioesterase YciA